MPHAIETKANEEPPYSEMTLRESLIARHSSRAFLPTPVPKSIIQSTLDLARFAPSNSNIQPHLVFLLTGKSLENLRSKLFSAASESTPNIPPLPAAYTHYRSEVGRQLYGEGMGIPRSDLKARNAAVLRNYQFFDAPVGAIVCIDKNLTNADRVSVGMWLQSWLLALTERGVGSCVQVCQTGYPDLVRRECGITDDLEILVAVSIGYEDPDFRANALRPARDESKKHVTFME
ncbi:putative nitroreductase protein [Botrytis fragariae]|uniref:Putative nitroreductase protein n=1 Tax=Botrytis fragariae TaxID=1964551 RepID=A0A8H6AQJ7_9HELO|nr:putative nitroreductase protein [Botrytis fragariae]KAF5871669.1 putative nitroreductase protein [Botrytis fragariae]